MKLELKHIQHYPTKTLYAIVEPRGDVNYHTVRYCGKDSIASWFNDEDWKTAKKSGFRCVKFEVTFNELKTKTNNGK